MGKQTMLHYRLFKEINDLFAAGHDDQARRLLMEVQSRSIALHDEITLLQNRLKTLEEAVDMGRNLFRRHGLYWLKANKIQLGPFCPRCYENEGGLIRLERVHGGLHCPYCLATLASPLHPIEEDGVPHARIIPFAK